MKDTEQRDQIRQKSATLAIFEGLPWSSLAEGDEQLDWPKSQTIIELYHVCVAYFVLICHKHNSLPLGPIQPF